MHYLDIALALLILRGGTANGEVGMWAPNGGGREEERDGAVCVCV